MWNNSVDCDVCLVPFCKYKSLWLVKVLVSQSGLILQCHGSCMSCSLVASKRSWTKNRVDLERDEFSACIRLLDLDGTVR